MFYSSWDPPVLSMASDLEQVEVNKCINEFKKKKNREKNKQVNNLQLTKRKNKEGRRDIVTTLRLK